jgi:hypothetical protein
MNKESEIKKWYLQFYVKHFRLATVPNNDSKIMQTTSKPIFEIMNSHYQSRNFVST